MDTTWDFLKTFEQKGFDGICHLSLGSGLELLFLEVPLLDGQENLFRIEQAPLIFSFHLQGFGTGLISQSRTRRQEVAVGPGKAILSYNPASQCRTRMQGRQTFRVLNIYISPEQLYQRLDGDLDPVPPPLRPILEKPCRTLFNRAVDISPAIRMLLDQVYNCPYRGGFRRVFLENKGMELIVRLLWELALPRGGRPAPPMPPGDREQIRLARDILIRELETPPSLKTLARMAGLNDTKLKRGFRRVYGTTVYGYLRRHRMEKSVEILESGQMNVDETAQVLGFHDTAHFIRQFKQNYGTTPGAFLKQARTAGTI